MLLSFSVRYTFTVAMEKEEWLTQEEAAVRLHVALDTMRRYVREGQFPRTKVGKRFLIPARALEEFLQSRLQYGARDAKPQAPTRKKA